MPAKCFGCGTEGYVQSECPYCADANDTRPTHCGICDPRTRLVTINIELGTVKKCPDCHPNAKLPPQFKRCTGCRMTIYAWDTNPCGNHESPVAVDKRPDREHIDRIVGTNS